jgi:hypothetical protein
VSSIKTTRDTIIDWFRSKLVPLEMAPDLQVGDDPPDPEPNEAWPLFDGPLGIVKTAHPRSTGTYYEYAIDVPVGWKETIATYGDPNVTHGPKGKVIVNPKWERANMMLARNLPFGIAKLYVHRKVEPYLREGLRRAEVELRRAGLDWEPLKVGCYDPRHQRHNSKLPLSDHTLGIAIDVDSALNAPKTTDVRPFTPDWHRLWPGGLPKQFVEGLKSVGFDWGGDWKPWKDPMHFSLRKIR